MGGFEAFCVAVFLSGIMQIILSRIKAGVIGNFFPASVINGMLSAIGLILILKQIPHASGFGSALRGNFEFFQEEDHETTFSGLMKALSALDPESVLIALVSLGVIQVWDRMSVKMNIFFRSIPAALVAVGVGTLLSEWVFGMFGMSLDPEHRVSFTRAWYGPTGVFLEEHPPTSWP